MAFQRSKDFNVSDDSNDGGGCPRKHADTSNDSSDIFTYDDDFKEKENTSVSARNNNAAEAVGNSPTEIEFTGVVVNKVFFDAASLSQDSVSIGSKLGRTAVKSEVLTPEEQRHSAKPWRHSVANKISSSKAAQLTPLRVLSESSSEGSVPRLLGKRKMKVISESDASDGSQPEAKPLRRRSVAKGATAKSFNVAYSEGSGDYDSDEFMSYSKKDVAVIDYRPTESIPVSKRLDYLEVCDRKLQKRQEKKAKAGGMKYKMDKAAASAQIKKKKRLESADWQCCSCQTCNCGCHKQRKHESDDSDDGGAYAAYRGRSVRKLFI